MYKKKVVIKTFIIIMSFVKLTPNAFTPTRGTDKSVGYDLASPNNYHIPPHSIEKIKTDLAFYFPDGCYGRLAMRSSLAQNGVDVLGGVIDPDFTGNVVVVVINHGDKEVIIKKGDRFAQIIFEKADFGHLLEVSHKDVKTTNRGSFGSTGE